MAEVAIGTAQLGLLYGVNNTSGQPNMDQAFDMLDMAIEQGVRVFDTAPAYGTAEEVLGYYLRERRLQGKVDVTSKLRANFREGADSTVVSERVFAEIRRSLDKLGLEVLDGYLLHDFKHMYDPKIMDTLFEAREIGLIKRLGVSIYEEKDALYAANSDLVDQIQIPYSVLDQRLDQGEFFDLSRKKGKLVHARSSFLQGLVFMQPERIPAHLSEARPYVQKLNELANQHGVSVFEMALLFSKSNPGITHVVFGAENCGQLSENLETFDGRGLGLELLAALRKEFINVPGDVLDPRKWNS